MHGKKLQWGQLATSRVETSSIVANRGVMVSRRHT